MSEWKMKRFWKVAAAVEVEGGFTVHLDGRAIKTPGKASLIVPTLVMAERWRWNGMRRSRELTPRQMPVTKSANSAVDKVTPQFDAVADMLGEYAGTDLLCYRASQPAELVRGKRAAWDPLLAWCARVFAAPLTPVSGVMFAPQPESSLHILRAYLVI